MSQHPQPWLDHNNPLSIKGPYDPYFPRGPGETMEGNYALKVLHATHTYVPPPKPGFLDHVTGKQNDAIFLKPGYWTPNNS